MNLIELLEQIKAIEPPKLPFLASSSIFEPGKIIMFEHDGRRYCGAHPFDWSSFRHAEKNAPGAFDCPIFDIDAIENRKLRLEFFRVMPFDGMTPTPYFPPPTDRIAT